MKRRVDISEKCARRDRKGQDHTYSLCHADDFRFYFNRKPLKSFVWERKMVRFTVR